jgi:hypothetical protein
MSQELKGAVIGRVVKRLFNGWYLIRPHKSNGNFVSERAEIFMKEYFGEYYKTNDQKSMTSRRMGFEDGYLECLKDLGIKLRYPNQVK